MAINRKYDLEVDLSEVEWMKKKIQSSEMYAQNLYAALCNNQFQKIDNWCILSDEMWSCSWRYAGGIMANIRGEGDYMDYYCSGIGTAELTPIEDDGIIRMHLPESAVSDEVREDLRKLGWIVVPYDDNDLYI